MVTLMASEVETIPAFWRLSERVATGGQPDAEQIAALRAAGCQVVLNLALPSSPGALPDEPDLVCRHGMRYLSIPVIWEAPAPEDVRRFFAAMEEHRGENVFVHCIANKRVSAFLYLYRILQKGEAEESARADLHRIWVPEEHWRRFLNEFLMSSRLDHAVQEPPVAGAGGRHVHGEILS